METPSHLTSRIDAFKLIGGWYPWLQWIAAFAHHKITHWDKDWLQTQRSSPILKVCLPSYFWVPCFNHCAILKTNLVRKLPSHRRWTWLAFTPSCQPPAIKWLGSEGVNSRVKTPSGAKPCVISDKLASGVAKVGLCASILGL